MTSILCWVPRCVALLVLGLALCGVSPEAMAQNPATLAKVTDLNKKAVAAYENLEFEDAIKLLQNALQICAAEGEGLNKHPVKARTHIHLGMVMIGGLKRREQGMAQFKRALEIDPNIKLTKQLVNPEIQAAFEEAKSASKPADEESAKPEEKPVATTDRSSAPTAPDGGRAPRNVKGVSHEPVTEAKPNSTISIKAAVEEKLGAEKVVLAYKPEGASDFLARDMETDDAGWFVARIPEPATQGNVVSYYIEARNKAGQALAANGSAAEPHVISLAAAPAISQADEDATSVRAGADEEEDDEGAGTKHKYFFALGIGTGGGWAKGAPEVNPTYVDARGEEQDLEFAGFAPAQLFHFAPEVGYFYSSSLLLSLQGRIQLVTGATDVYDESCTQNRDPETMVGRCPPASGALALLGKGTWFFGGPSAFRPFASLSAGFGEIRHLVALSSLKDCGREGETMCQDTVLGGLVLVGPGAGFTYELSDKLSFVGSVNALAGFPKPTVNFDVNVGFALGL